MYAGKVSLKSWLAEQSYVFIDIYLIVKSSYRQFFVFPSHSVVFLLDIDLLPSEYLEIADKLCVVGVDQTECSLRLYQLLLCVSQVDSFRGKPLKANGNVLFAEWRVKQWKRASLR